MFEVIVIRCNNDATTVDLDVFSGFQKVVKPASLVESKQASINIREFNFRTASCSSKRMSYKRLILHGGNNVLQNGYVLSTILGVPKI